MAELAWQGGLRTDGAGAGRASNVIPFVKRICALLLFIAGMRVDIFSLDPSQLNRIVFLNATGYDILHIFISTEGGELFGPDILLSHGVLRDGNEKSFYIHYPGSSLTLDVWMIDEDYDSYRVDEVAIRDGRPALLEVSPDHYSGPVGSQAFGEVVVTNDGESDIWYLFFSPASSKVWGIDVLSDESIFPRGDSLRLLVPLDSSSQDYDLLALDEHHDTIYRQVPMSAGLHEWHIDLSEGQP